MNSESYSASELRTRQAYIRSDSQSHGQNLSCIAIQDTFRRPKQCLAAGFEPVTSNSRSLKEVVSEEGRANRSIVCRVGRSDAAIRRCWQERADDGRFWHHKGSGRAGATADREDRAIVRSAVDSSVSTTTIYRRLIERNLGSTPDYGGAWLDPGGTILTGGVQLPLPAASIEDVSRGSVPNINRLPKYFI